MKHCFARIFVLVACIAVCATVANATVVLGGTAQTYIAQALQTLNVQYTDVNSMFVDPSGYGAGDTIILSEDGGTDNGYDYSNFLNAGGHLIVTGGSNWDPTAPGSAITSTSPTRRTGGTRMALGTRTETISKPSTCPATSRFRTTP